MSERKFEQRRQMILTPTKRIREAGFQASETLFHKRSSKDKKVVKYRKIVWS